MESRKEKSAAVFAVRRANYTHRRKGVFNAQIIEHLERGSNVRNCTKISSQKTPKNDKHLQFILNNILVGQWRFLMC